MNIVLPAECCVAELIVVIDINSSALQDDAFSQVAYNNVTSNSGNASH